MNIQSFLESAVLSLMSDMIVTVVGNTNHVEISIAAFHPKLPAGTLMMFSTFLHLDRHTDVLEYISTMLTNEQIFSFVPKVEEALIVFLAHSPIQDLHEHWQNDLITPYSISINKILSQAVQERMCYAHLVHK